jgi:hypothetical protein
MMITFARLAVALAKGCMTVLLATSARELVVGLNNTGMMTMSNWPFPPTTGAVPWTAKQIKKHAQQERQQLPESPL